MNRVIWAVVLLAACKESNPNPTKAGATILTWQIGDSDRTTIRTAKLTDIKVADYDYDAVTADTKVKLKVHLETATAVFVEDGKEVTHTAPTKLEVKVVDANDFTLSTKTGACGGPHYDMALPPSRDMILTCRVIAKKPSYDVGFWLYAYGDGRIDDGNPKTVKVISQ